MIAELIVFVVFASIAVVSGIGVVVSKNPVYAILLLVLNFFAVAALYLVLSAQFVAFIQVLVYAGAIMVLFLFVVMLLNLTGAIEDVADKLRLHRTVALCFGVIFLFELSMLAAGSALAGAGKTALPANFGESGAVGSLLFSRYLLPFEATSVLLLIAMVGSIVLAKRRQ